MIVALLMLCVIALPAMAQTAPVPPTIFQNFFVTGDYVVAGWVEGAPDGSGFAPGTITIPDPKQQPFLQSGVPATVPAGADIVAAYLYWATVEGNQTLEVGKNAFFNNYPVTGVVLGNPNAPVSWSSGGCSGNAQGSKTMRTYRADVRPYLPVDTNPSSPTFGFYNLNTTYNVRLADSGSNGNAQPNALGATLVIIYKVLSPNVPLNGIVLYDGAFAPSNTASIFTDTISGFYQPATTPTTAAKITHIVANGQTNKNESVFLNNTSQPLPSLYGAGAPAFPGIYGSWDNPTWNISKYVTAADTSETTTVVPSASNSGCVSWGVIILSTPVQDSDGDGLLDVWEQAPPNSANPNPAGSSPGYIDVKTGNFIALPGARPDFPDIFIELDYLSNLDGSAGPLLHTHLPKQAALDAVGDALCARDPNTHQCTRVQVHFDVGNVYQGDPYVITGGTGGNAISEATLMCNDTGAAPLCAFPGQPSVGWKGGLIFVRDNASVPNSNPAQPLGNFQLGRGQSYHYVLSGHSLGWARSAWSTGAAAMSLTPLLTSIVNTGSSATVTIQSPPGVLKPGDCPNAAFPECSDANSSRVTIAGALGPDCPVPPLTGTSPTCLNGTYIFTNVSSSTVNNVTTTTFTVTPTSNVPNVAFKYSCGPTELACSGQPQLVVTYLGPSSTSGHSDFNGGGDSAMTLGLWGFDDPANCQPDPTKPLTATNPVYCNNQVGTGPVQAGTLLHELGHTLTLTHGGTYYNNATNPSQPTYEVNCKSNFLSNMNYLFQVRGFVEGGPFDYSDQTLAALNEVFPTLSEFGGIGLDIFTGNSADHLTRWYSAPNATDIKLQNTTGGRFATRHCDGTPLTPADVPAVRVDGTVSPSLGSTFSAPLDFNNDLQFPDAVLSPGEDLNYNGFTGDSAFSGFNDWQVLLPPAGGPGPALRQTSARAGVLGLSGGGGQAGLGGGQAGLGGGQAGLGGGQAGLGGGQAGLGGGQAGLGGGQAGLGGGQAGLGGGQAGLGGGDDQDTETANSTVDPPSGLTCTIPQNAVPGCVSSSTLPGTFLENAKSVPLTWTPPAFGQIRKYSVWRAVGSFPTLASVLLNIGKFTNIKTLNGAPPATTFTDPNVKNGVTYTYFVTDTNKQGSQSGPSNPVVITVKF